MKNDQNSLAFQHKYRPRRYSGMVGLEYLERQFHSIVKNKNYNAIMFKGLNGHGKTTLAEIYLLRFFCEHPNGLDACLECSSCSSILNEHSHSDVYRITGDELNANNFPFLQRFCDYVPVRLYKRVVFIDDVDFVDQSLLEKLKTILDVYHSTVLFIFTVTSIHKIPLPLIQRCKNIPVTKVTYQSLEKLIRDVCGAEDLNIGDDDAVQMLISLADQSPRIILTSLEVIKEESGYLSVENLRLPLVVSNLQELTQRHIV